MKINEIFYSLQGEGKSVGKPTLFIRLSGCNLKCKFCDTKHHINGHEITNKERELLAKNESWTITGGEPLLQQEELLKMIREHSPRDVEIETNGTIIPSLFLVRRVTFNCSPKEKRFQPRGKNCEPVLLGEVFKHSFGDIVKFVYSDKKSEKFIEDTIQKYVINPKMVYIMPEGANKKELEKNSIPVWNYCMEKGFNFGARLHVNIFNTKKKI